MLEDDPRTAALDAIAELAGVDHHLKKALLDYYNDREFLRLVGETDNVRCIGMPYARGWNDCLRLVSGIIIDKPKRKDGILVVAPSVGDLTPFNLEDTARSRGRFDLPFTSSGDAREKGDL